MPDDRNGGKPPLNEILDALKDMYLTLRHSSRSKRTLRQTRVLKRVFVVLEDCGIAVRKRANWAPVVAIGRGRGQLCATIVVQCQVMSFSSP
jgi:hypothetical protein